jgi:GDSL-like lipase/acylhydrolase family protein
MKRLVAPAIVLVSLALALLAGEVAVRLLFKEQSVMYPRYHTDYRYGPYTLRGIRPNSEFWHTSVDGSWRFVTNSRGFRNDRDFAYDKPAGTLRVLSLGDSHTQGYEVRQNATFSSVLERYLTGHGVRAEVLNAGVSGFSNAEELAFLENEGVRYHPDVVVLAFYANDFDDNFKAGLFGLEGDRLVERKHEHVPGVRIQNFIYSVPGVKWLGENSYFYSLLFNTVWTHFKMALTERAVRQAADKAAPPETESDFEYAVARTGDHSQAEIALAVALLGRMQRFCTEHGIRLIVVDIPRPTGAYTFAESLPPVAVEALGGMHVELVGSHALFDDFGGVAEMHVPHGHRHISEFTHTVIGTELGRRIIRRSAPERR